MWDRHVPRSPRGSRRSPEPARSTQPWVRMFGVSWSSFAKALAKCGSRSTGPQTVRWNSGIRAKASRTTSSPLCTRPVLPSHRKRVRAWAKVPILDPRVEDRAGIRDLVDPLPGEGIGLVDDVVAEHGRGGGLLDRAVHPQLRDAREGNASPGLHLPKPRERRCVVGEPVRGLEMDDPDAVASPCDRRAPRSSRAGR
jgi:hypothetical protein